MFKRLKIFIISKILWKKYKKKYIGGIVPQGSENLKQIPIEFKVEKVYDFKKGGRYLFSITTDKPIKDKTYVYLRESLEANNKRLMKDLGIISSFIFLDGLSIKVLPSGEEMKPDPALTSYIEKGYTPTRKENL